MPSAPPHSRIDLWPGTGLVVVPSIQTGLHAHHAIQVSLSWASELEIRSTNTGEARACPGAWMPPDCPHSVESDSTVVQLYLAPETRTGLRLKAAFEAERSPIELTPEIATAMRAGLASALEPESSRTAPGSMAAWAPGTQAKIALERAVLAAFELLLVSTRDHPNPITAPEPTHLDERVALALRLLETRTGRGLSVAELAERVGLSDRRLTQLFSTEIGLPVRRYVLWLRVVDAVASLSRGDSQTEAAWAAGFSDEAHMSRSFQRLFATAPGAFSRDFVRLQNPSSPPTPLSSAPKRRK